MTNILSKDLRDAVLQAAIQGKLTERLESDGNVSDLLKQIKEEKEQLIKDKKIKKEKELEPISDEDKPFDIPKSWEWVKLRDICHTLTCGLASTPKYVSEEIGKPFLSAQNVKPFKFIPQNYKYIEEDVWNKLRLTCLPQKGDILLTRVGAGIGECAIIDNDLDFAIYVSLTLIKLVDYNLIYNKYILYLLNSPLGKQLSNINTLGKQASQGNLNVQNVRNFVIPIPPLAEQKRIVECVDALMKEIDELEKIEIELENLKKQFPIDLKASLLQAAMQGKLTKQLPTDSSVDDLLDKIKEERKKFEDEGKIKKSSSKSCLANSLENVPFDIPKNWKWIKMKELVKINCGSKDANYGTEDGKYPFFTCSKDVIKAPDYSFDGECLLLPGNGANVGEVFYYNGKFEAYQRTYVLEKYSEDFNMYFLKYSLNWNWKQWNSNKLKGSAIPYITLKNLEDYLIPLPPLEEQGRIVNVLEILLPLVNSL